MVLFSLGYGVAFNACWDWDFPILLSAKLELLVTSQMNWGSDGQCEVHSMLCFCSFWESGHMKRNRMVSPLLFVALDLESIKENADHFLVRAHTAGMFAPPHSTQLPVEAFDCLAPVGYHGWATCFGSLSWLEPYPRLSLSVSLGKVFGMLLRCLKVQWTSFAPGQLQLRGQGVTARV